MIDRAAIVTGAGKGIGEALALKLGAMGIAVCCNSLTDSGAKTAKRIRAAEGRAIFVGGDAAEEMTAARVVGETLAAYGGIDILVNNAGVVLPGTAETTSIDDWDRTMAVNVRSVFLLSASPYPPQGRHREHLFVGRPEGRERSLRLHRIQGGRPVHDPCHGGGSHRQGGAGKLRLSGDHLDAVAG